MTDPRFLIDFAQLAIVLAGFTSVFAALIPKDSEFCRVDRVHAAAMILASYTTVICALTPFYLEAIGVEGMAIWKVATAFLLLLGTPCAFYVLKRVLAMTREEQREMGLVHIWVGFGLIGVMLVIAITGLFSDRAKDLFIAALMLGFAAGSMSFLSFALNQFSERRSGSPS